MGSRLFPIGALVAVVGMCALAPPAAQASNDASAPTPLTYGTPEQVDSSKYTVVPGEQNTAAPFTQQCASGHNVGIARSAWYTIRGTGHRVVISTEGSNFDTALFAYTGSPSGPFAGCNDDQSGSNLQSSLSLDTGSGRTYAIQVGRACNETGPPTCVSQPPTGVLRVTATKVETSPRLRIKNTFAVRASRRYTRFTSLTVSGAPRGSRVALRCRGRGCPFRRTSVKLASSRTVRFSKRLKRARLRPRARLTVQVTKPGFVGWVRTYTIRSSKLPSRKTYCLAPESPKPKRHCG